MQRFRSTFFLVLWYIGTYYRKAVMSVCVNFAELSPLFRLPRRVRERNNTNIDIWPISIPFAGFGVRCRFAQICPSRAWKSPPHFFPIFHIGINWRFWIWVTFSLANNICVRSIITILYYVHILHVLWIKSSEGHRYIENLSHIQDKIFSGSPQDQVQTLGGSSGEPQGIP